MWYEAEYSVRPDEVDEVSSSSYVYVRRNIQAVQKEDDTVYTCEEQAVPKANWELYKKVLGHSAELADVEDALVELAGLIGG